MDAKDEQLAAAADKGDAKAVRRMLAGCCASPDARDGRANPALVLAAMRGHLEKLKVLHQNGANLEATDEDGWTALIAAASNGEADCTAALLSWGVDVDAADADGGGTRKKKRKKKKKRRKKVDDARQKYYRHFRIRQWGSVS